MSRRIITTLLAAVSIVACADHSTPTGPSIDPLSNSRGVESPATGPWARVVTGETGPGSLYELRMPTNWNGDVVYYAHGIVVGPDVALPVGDGFPAVRDALGALGYAVAYSSFDENGWAEKDGAQRTHQLRGIFTSTFGKANHSFLAGTSLGGLIVQDLAESFPNQYDGVLAMCAPLAGTIEEINYIANVRVLFDAFYPGALGGNVLAPTPMSQADIIAAAQAAVGANPLGLGLMSLIRQTPLAGNNGTELFISLVYALTYDVQGIDDFFGRTHGHSMFDNSNTTYSLVTPIPAYQPYVDFANATVGRFTATPDAINYLEKYYVPTGNLQLPTVTLHTTRDPLVPFQQEAIFASRVAGTGTSSKLTQQSVDRFGHCAFQTSEMVNAFQTLAAQVQ